MWTRNMHIFMPLQEKGPGLFMFAILTFDYTCSTGTKWKINESPILKL